MLGTDQWNASNAPQNRTVSTPATLPYGLTSSRPAARVSVVLTAMQMMTSAPKSISTTTTPSLNTRKDSARYLTIKEISDLDQQLGSYLGRVGRGGRRAPTFQPMIDSDEGFRR